LPDDFGYINARIRVMRTRLLTERQEQDLVAAANYVEFLRLLTETDLAADLTRATAPAAALGDLDQALSRHLQRLGAKVLGLSQGDAREQLAALVARWDLLNLKTLARGLLAGRPAQEIRSQLVPLGTLRFSLLEAAAGGDLDGALQTLSLSRHPLLKVFAEAVRAQIGSGELLALEVALDQGYYQQVRRLVRGQTMARFWRLEIDLRNLITATELRGQPPEPRFYLPGGRLGEADFLRLCAGDLAALPADLDLPEGATLVQVQAMARQRLAEEAAQVASSDSDGPGIALDYLLRLEIQVARLRLIARGKFYQLSQEQLAEVLRG
jgi:V/A-type H+-transporting ATPase subunit C